MAKEPEIKQRRMAMIGKVAAVSVEPGTKIFDLEGEKLLGIVMDRCPVINGQTVYLSTDDWDAARDALPGAPTAIVTKH